VASTRTLYVAFSLGVDYPALQAVEGILECRTEACLLSQSVMERVLEKMGNDHGPHELLFESARDAEIAHVACAYVFKLAAREVRIAACGEYIWVRLSSGESHTHLLFRRPKSETEETSTRKRRGTLFHKAGTNTTRPQAD
jgi:hypothetical protein